MAENISLFPHFYLMLWLPLLRDRQQMCFCGFFSLLRHAKMFFSDSDAQIKIDAQAAKKKGFKSLTDK
jgi:hypothetical protein